MDGWDRRPSEAYARPRCIGSLLVEDDANLREATQEALRRDGFDVQVAADGQAGLDHFRGTRPDVVLLDIMLPALDGVSVCRAIRAESTTPVIMLSARGDPIDVVLGLEAGADDYVIKPFDVPVLAARLRAVLRRAQLAAPPAPSRAAAGDRRGCHDCPRRWGRGSPTHHRVPPAGRPRTQRRHRADAPGAARGRVGVRLAGDTRLVDVHVQRLRVKLGELIETVRGVGYKLVRE